MKDTGQKVAENELFGKKLETEKKGHEISYLIDRGEKTKSVENV